MLKYLIKLSYVVKSHCMNIFSETVPNGYIYLNCYASWMIESFLFHRETSRKF